ncbi:hypothetical protein NQ314_015666, partial [Rhamnusium bicolor]
NIAVANSTESLTNRITYAIRKGVQYSTDQSDIATYEEVEEIGTNKYKEILLIDVRGTRRANGNWEKKCLTQILAQQLGYKNLKNYLGGWTEWEERIQNNVNFEELKQLKDDPNYLLIDVREPNELVDDGFIPGSINIPLNDVEEVLTGASATEFREKYGRDKPGTDFNIIFSCRSGRRSANAQERVIALGFKNVYNYSGGWLDWAANTNKGNLKKLIYGKFKIILIQ